MKKPHGFYGQKLINEMTDDEFLEYLELEQTIRDEDKIKLIDVEGNSKVVTVTFSDLLPGDVPGIKYVEQDGQEPVLMDRSKVKYIVNYNLVYWIEETEEHIDFMINNTRTEGDGGMSTRLIKDELTSEELEDMSQQLHEKLKYQQFTYDKTKDKRL